MQIKLRRFDPSKMAEHAVCVLVARRRAGKSTAIFDLMYHKRDIPAAVAISASEEGNHAFSNFLPDSFVYSQFDEAILERIINRQRKMLAAKDAGKMPQDTDTRCLLILDDIGFDTKAMRTRSMQQLLMNGRHWHISLWTTLQYCKGLGPDACAQCDYVFCFADHLRENREKLYKSFFGCFPDFNSFQAVFDAVTEDFGCLVLDQTSRSSKIEDIVFHWKAAMRPPFKFGSPEMWRFHQRVYKPNTEDESNEDFKTQFSRQKNTKAGPLVSVKKLHR